AEPFAQSHVGEHRWTRSRWRANRIIARRARQPSARRTHRYFRYSGRRCACLTGTWPLRHRVSALGVAHPGADDAVLAAVLVARLERRILRRAEPRRRRVAERAADIAAVDRKRRAITLHRGHDLAGARAFLECGRARLVGF